MYGSYKIFLIKLLGQKLVFEKIIFVGLSKHNLVPNGILVELEKSSHLILNVIKFFVKQIIPLFRRILYLQH